MKDRESLSARYMVLEVGTSSYEIVDTAWHGGEFFRLCLCNDNWYAHRISRLLNESEGCRHGNS